MTREKKITHCQPNTKRNKRKSAKILSVCMTFTFMMTHLEKKSDIFKAIGSKKTLILTPMSKKCHNFTWKNRGKPFDIQHVTGLVNMGMSDTASGKHGSNKRGLQYKKAA